jgi:hypothetical protein
MNTELVYITSMMLDLIYDPLAQPLGQARWLARLLLLRCRFFHVKFSSNVLVIITVMVKGITTATYSLLETGAPLVKRQLVEQVHAEELLLTVRVKVLEVVVVVVESGGGAERLLVLGVVRGGGLTGRFASACLLIYALR